MSESPEDLAAALPEKPYFEVTYLTAEELAAPPDPTKKAARSSPTHERRCD